MSLKKVFLISLFISVSFSSAEVMFSRKEALMRKAKVDDLVFQTKIKSKVATGVLALGGLAVVRYYFPGIFPNISLLSHDNSVVSATVLPTDIVAKIQAMKPQFSDDQAYILKGLAEQHANELGRKNIMHKAWDLVKSFAPFIIAQPIFGYIDSGRGALVNACFPHITLTWFIQQKTRVVYFGLLLEENVKQLQQERDKEKVASLELMTKDSLECFVDYVGSIVGYMNWRAEQTEKNDLFMGSKLQNIADITSDFLESFCRDMNTLLASREGHIGLVGKVESFSDYLDYNIKSFMICENEVLAPMVKTRSEFTGESYKGLVSLARQRLFPKSIAR